MYACGETISCVFMGPSTLRASLECLQEMTQNKLSTRTIIHMLCACTCVRPHVAHVERLYVVEGEHEVHLGTCSVEERVIPVSGWG